MPDIAAAHTTIAAPPPRSARYLHKHEESKARIQAPAPQWKAKAVVKGEITDISLSDFLGK